MSKKPKNERPPDAKARRSPSEVSALQSRVLKCKEILPAGVVTLFISRFPEFNTYKKASRVNNVVSLRIVDEDITEKLEGLVSEFLETGAQERTDDGSRNQSVNP